MEKDILSTVFGSCPVDMSDDDILDAMKSIPGYLDITPGDFKELFGYAYRHALERIAQSLLARDVMTKKVVSVTATTSLKETAAIMAAHGIAGIPVVDDRGSVVGIISEKDFLSHMGDKKTPSIMDVIAQCLASKGCVAISMRSGYAKDLMTSPAIAVHEDTPIFEIAAIFAEKQINRVPVLDMIKNMGINGGHIRGDLPFAMIATEDIAEVAAQHLLEPNFSGKTVRELLGPRDISMEEVTRIIGEKIGKPDLPYVHFSREKYINGLLQAGLAKDMAEQLAELDAGINDRLFGSGEPRTQENRTSTDFKQFADFFAQVYKS